MATSHLAVDEWLSAHQPDNGGQLDLEPIRDLLNARTNALSVDGEHPWLNKRLAEYVPALLAELEQTRDRLAAVEEAVSA